MSSTFGESSSQSAPQSSPIDRKALKKDDAFVSSLRTAFDRIGANSKQTMGALGVLLLIALAATFFMKSRQARLEEAMNRLFGADQAYRTELQALAESGKIVPPTPSKEDLQKNLADKANEKPAADTSVLEHKKFDIEAHLPESVKKYQAVIAEFDGTRAAHEARMKLGDLYYAHGQADKAVPIFMAAVDKAPNALEATLANVSLGYAQENSGKHTEAVQAFEKALKAGEFPFKGDVLLGMARNYVLLNDAAKARSTYDQILSQLPNTEHSRMAEALKAQLGQ